MYFNGLVLLGKFTGLSPIFHGKIYGFRFRFSQQNQSKKMYCSILTGGMIWKRIHLNIHINFRRLLPVPDLYISMIYIYISYIYIIFLNKNLKLVSTPMGASRYSHHCLTTSTATSEACTTGNFESDPQINRPKQCLCQARGQGLTESGARGFSRSFAIQWLGGSDLELPRVSQAHTSSVGQWETSKQSWIWSGDGDPDDISLFFSEKNAGSLKLLRFIMISRLWWPWVLLN